jgi:hypothetical protein
MVRQLKPAARAEDQTKDCYRIPFVDDSPAPTETGFVVCAIRCPKLKPTGARLLPFWAVNGSQGRWRSVFREALRVPHGVHYAASRGSLMDLT